LKTHRHQRSRYICMDLETHQFRPLQFPGMYETQLGEDGGTGRLLFGSYTSFAPGGGGGMPFKGLASAPVSKALLKMRRTRSIALASTRGVFMEISWQNPIVLIFLRRGGRQLNLVWRGMNWVLLCLISLIHKTRLYVVCLYRILEGWEGKRNAVN